MIRLNKSPFDKKLDIVEILELEKSNLRDWGLEGYDPPRKSFDCLIHKKERIRLEQIRNNKMLKVNWPPLNLNKDSNENLIWPQRNNFINDVRK
jgi:hypothetical protein